MGREWLEGTTESITISPARRLSSTCLGTRASHRTYFGKPLHTLKIEDLMDDLMKSRPSQVVKDGPANDLVRECAKKYCIERTDLPVIAP